MSKVLVLKNEASYTATDESTISSLSFVYRSALEVCALYDDLTDENLDGCTLDGVVYSRKLTSAKLSGHNPVTMTVSTIQKPLPEEEALQELVERQNAEIAELEKHQATPEMEDKVEGYDILTGGEA